MECEFLNGKANGKWKKYYNSKLLFESDLNDKKHGHGNEFYKGKLLFEDQFLYDYRIKRKFYINRILEYEGEYLFYKKWNRKGYDENGNIIS